MLKRPQKPFHFTHTASRDTGNDPRNQLRLESRLAREIQGHSPPALQSQLFNKALELVSQPGHSTPQPISGHPSPNAPQELAYQHEAKSHRWAKVCHCSSHQH